SLDLDLSRIWLVDPQRNREGPADLVVRGGILRSVRWLRGDEARGVDDHGVVVAPSFIDLHAHFREPGNDAAETIASGARAAAHGGFGTVCLMPNTDPPLEEAASIRQALAAGDSRSGSGGAPVGLRGCGAVTAGRRGGHR